jgi:hypothetical protein
MWRLYDEDHSILAEEHSLLPFLQKVVPHRKTQMIVLEHSLDLTEIDGQTLHRFLQGHLDMEEAPRLWALLCNESYVRHIFFSRGEYAVNTNPEYPSVR